MTDRYSRLIRELDARVDTCVWLKHYLEHQELHEDEIIDYCWASASEWAQRETACLALTHRDRALMTVTRQQFCAEVVEYLEGLMDDAWWPTDEHILAMVADGLADIWLQECDHERPTTTDAEDWLLTNRLGK